MNQMRALLASSQKLFCVSFMVGTSRCPACGIRGRPRGPSLPDFVFSSFYAFVLLPVLLLLMAGCKTAPRPGTFVPRTGDEIVVCGQFFHTGTPVVLWMDPGGYTPIASSAVLCLLKILAG